MSWVKIDDGFEENSKVALISDAAHRLWMRASCWAARNENLHLEGFIPEALLEKVSGGLSKRKREKLAKELVEANGAGTKEHGLWEKVSGGFQIHDWHKYRPEKQPMTRSESASIAGKKSAEARRKRTGTAQPGRSGDSRTNGERSEVRSEPRSPNDVQPNDDINEHRTSRTPDPAPDPVDPKAAEVDPRPPGQSDETPPQRQQRPPGNLEAALKLPVMQRAQLLIDNPHTLTFVEPHNWPEVRWLGDHVAEATGWHKLRWTQPSKAVMRLVALLAEFSGAELQTFVKAMHGEEWFRDKGFTALSDEVVRRTLGRAGGGSDVEAENRRRREEREAAEAAGKERARQRLAQMGGA